MPPINSAPAPWPLPPDHPLLYDWSAEGQKLYAWLRHESARERSSTCPPTPSPATAPDRASDGDAAEAVTTWRRHGYLAAYATAEHVMERVLPVSRNTVTKLIAEMAQRRMCVPRRIRRGGHVFLLGEWGVHHSPLVRLDLYWQCYYLDGLVAADATAHEAERSSP